MSPSADAGGVSPQPHPRPRAPTDAELTGRRTRRRPARRTRRNRPGQPRRIDPPRHIVVNGRLFDCRSDATHQFTFLWFGRYAAESQHRYPHQFVFINAGWLSSQPCCFNFHLVLSSDSKPPRGAAPLRRASAARGVIERRARQRRSPR